MKIIKYGAKAVITNLSNKGFKCSYCGCLFIAGPLEYISVPIPMKPNTYAWCPKCGCQTWHNPAVEDYDISEYEKIIKQKLYALRAKQRRT